MANEIDGLLRAIQSIKGGGLSNGANSSGSVAVNNTEKPTYGQEVARPTQEQALAGLVNAIQSYRKDNPTQLPFPVGTPTLANRQFAEQQKQNEISNQLNQDQLALSAYKASRSGSGSSGGSGGKLTATERKNQILNSLVPGIMNAKNSGTGLEQVTNELYGSIGELGESVSTKDIDDLVTRLYGDTAIGDGFGSFEEPEMTPEEIQSKALKQRPWWQKAIDILPGKQFR